MSKFERLQIDFGQNTSQALKLMNARMGGLNKPKYKPDTVEGANDLAKKLEFRGGFPQQNRMIQDKRKS